MTFLELFRNSIGNIIKILSMELETFINDSLSKYLHVCEKREDNVISQLR